MFRANKETAVYAARRILVYAVRIIKGCACAEKRADEKERKGEGEKDLKPTSTSYSSGGATTEIGIWKSRSTIAPRASNSKERVANERGEGGGGEERERESARRKKRRAAQRAEEPKEDGFRSGSS